MANVRLSPNPRGNVVSVVLATPETAFVFSINEMKTGPTKLLFSFLLFFGFAAAQTVEEIPFDVVFPPEAQAKMGLTKLSDSEKESLRLYFVSHMGSMYRAGIAKAATQDTRAPLAPKAPGYSSLGEEHAIKENIDRGSMILLDDGSLWEVDPLERLDASLWLKLSSVRVLESQKGSIGYPYILINTDDGEKAHAKFMGKKARF
jgi:hypothetical protein